MSKRVVIYCRISRDKVGAGLGVDRQEQDCRELAARLGWAVAAVHRDNDLSAYSGKPRPGYLRLLDGIRAGQVDAVLAWHTDRLHRSPVELEDYIAACEPRAVTTVTVKAGPLDLSSPSGRMVARQLGAVARYEVEHQIERQQRAKLQAATDGVWRGGRRPYGYAADGTTVMLDEAAEVLRASRAVLAGTSLRAIAADLNGRGMPTSTGGQWRQDTVRKMLLRPRNAGLMEYHGNVIGDAGWPAIVPEDTWRAVAALLRDPARRTQLTTARRWLGSGLYQCGLPLDHDQLCGALVRPQISSTHARGRRMKPQYVCRDSMHIARDAASVDEVVQAVIVERLSRPDAIDLLHRDSRHDTTDLHTRALALRERLAELAALYADGDIDARQLREGSDRIRQQLGDVEEKIGAAARGSVLDGLVGVPDPGAVWASLGLDRRRAVIDSLIVVRLLPARKGRPPGWRPGRGYFDPSTVDIAWRD